MRDLLGVLLALILATPAGAEGLPQGIAVGDVTDRSAVVWARTGVAGTLVVELATELSFTNARRARVDVGAEGDFAGQVTFDGLAPHTRYHVRVRVEGEGGAADASLRDEGAFRTAPSAEERVAVHMLVGGDVGGQAFCRHRDHGYRIFRPMADLEADFFVANGDMIYGDDPCPAEGPGDWPNIEGGFPSVEDPDVDWTDYEAVREIYFAHWRYNRADSHQRAFLRHTPMYVQWDDHEVINDFGAGWDSWPQAPERPGYPTLVDAGRAALFAHNPIAGLEDARPAGTNPKLYRSVRWGKEMELFLLDARSERSRNDAPDGPGKSMLGSEQVAWLVGGLKHSDATWKIVSSDVPLSYPTGYPAHFGRDAFAGGTGSGPESRTGAETELLGLLRGLDEADVENIVFVVTDVHLALSLRYDLDLDADGDSLRFHELITGPLNAVRADTPAQLDPTLAPVILYGEGGIFNFGYLRVEPTPGGASRLRYDVRDELGAVREGSRLLLDPR